MERARQEALLKAEQARKPPRKPTRAAIRPVAVVQLVPVKPTGAIGKSSGKVKLVTPVARKPLPTESMPPTRRPSEDDIPCEEDSSSAMVDDLFDTMV